MPLVMVGSGAQGGRGRGGRQAEELAKRKAAHKRQQQAAAAAALSMIGEIDGGSGTVNRDQVRTLLQRVTGHEEVDADGLDMLLAHAQKRAGLAPTLPQEEALVPSTAVLESLSRYRYYLSRRKEVHELFARWDLDGNFKLDKAELQALLEHKESQKPRDVGGILTTLIPTAGDIEFIILEADHNADGMIDRSELLPALGLWATLAERKASQSRACSLL